ncbi:vanadium-dependent haloperoxidase [Ferruginibacter paludis]|uniref:vanadium-dependent haloperoxidase n=1 Tax=Ferruginibacter paludis TaxID=1310417 RepID=UPI0025B59A16|nr:vanadium-dependent haloperoxidase [Ferruginibacter paludis]MDN3658019.1 vanadium-dependent haloperoxidase [Ferruginibacter paludis]
MKSLFKKSGCYIFLLILITGCHQKKAVPKISDAEILHQNEDLLTQIIIYDVFTPPVASRIYVYSSLASYEAIKYSKEGTPSIAEKLKGFGKIPAPEKGKKYDFTLAATKAFFTVVRNVKVFSVDSLKSYEENVYTNFKESLDDSVYERSVALGDTIGKVILARAKTDGYLQSRGKPKHLGSEEAGKWRPTPPDYSDGIEWCWNTMKPMVLDSASQFMPPRPPAFSTDTNSVFYKNTREVYNIAINLTEEQKATARYWDDNPFVIEHSGHMMFGNKKITPGGHWMGITAIACKQTHADPVKTAQAYALTAIAMYDAFISCWDEKYRSNVIRPVTVINESIDQGWTPYLQTPPFPEYTSGHSTITRSAAVVLTKLFGDNFAFQDTSDLRYIGMQRHFNSFVQAADEASISRVYGGIHYRNSVDEGANAGRKVGEYIVEKIIK